MNMPEEPIVIPEFQSESQEADWWDAHPEVATELMSRALKDGTARRRVPRKAVTLRLRVCDIEAAQQLAEQKGLPYEAYIEMLLHDALEREQRPA
jgi:predicted DNA binding CopG/RHH family protein